MKKMMLPLAAVALSAAACNKNTQQNCDPVTTAAPTSEVQRVKSYLDGAGITNVVKDDRGFYYRINNAGSAEKPTICSSVTVSYKGTRTDGFVFDQTQPGATTSFSLGNVILGWQEGVPLVGKGGDIDLFLPPSLAYGSQDRTSGGIPPNSILIFNVKVVSF